MTDVRTGTVEAISPEAGGGGQGEADVHFGDAAAYSRNTLEDHVEVERLDG